MGTKHTPGPLEVAVTGMLDDFSGACSLAVVYSQDAEDRGDTYETALIVCAGDIDEEEAKANAYLYAASPDLLAALGDVQAALACLRDDVDYIHPKHGKISLEEVKYLIVDPAINKADPQ